MNKLKIKELNKELISIDKQIEKLDKRKSQINKLLMKGAISLDDKWKQWFVLCCDHPISPQPNEVWNGAVETVCAYLRNEINKLNI